MKKILTLTLCLALLLGLFSGCGGKQYDPLAGVETTVFTVDAKPSRYFSAAATLRAAAVMDRSFTSTVMSAYFS